MIQVEEQISEYRSQLHLLKNAHLISNSLHKQGCPALKKQYVFSLYIKKLLEM